MEQNKTQVAISKSAALHRSASKSVSSDVNQRTQVNLATFVTLINRRLTIVFYMELSVVIHIKQSWQMKTIVQSASTSSGSIYARRTFLRISACACCGHQSSTLRAQK
ncbi:hypothetical protein Plhal304r1_c066g0154171 [Plasmopara halstedii]